MTHTILVVDDHAPTAKMIRAAFEKLGMRVRTASNGAECLLAVRDERPDLIVLDVRMPVMDGFHTLQQLHQSPETTDIPVIMLTARTADCDIALGWRWGVTSYLTKPFSLDNLLLLAERVLGAAAEADREAAPQSR